MDDNERDLAGQLETPGGHWPGRFEGGPADGVNFKMDAFSGMKNMVIHVAVASDVDNADLAWHAYGWSQKMRRDVPVKETVFTHLGTSDEPPNDPRA